MIYIINNNTTHNYSRYSTGPSHIYNASLKVKYPIKNIINSNIFENNQPYLFQTKPLLCWGPDLAFLNLRNSFSNVFKALQICWSAARNNKKIVFINGNDAIEADSTLVNTWLIQQCKRHSMPYKLNNISNIAAKYINHLTVPSECLTSTLLNKALFNHLNTFLNSLKIKTNYVYKKKIQSFIKNSNTLFNSNFTRPLQQEQRYTKDFYARNYVERQINQRQVFTDSGSFQPKIKQHEFTKTPKLEIQKASKIENHNVIIGKVVYSNEKQYVVNNQLQIKIKKAIQLQVKEAQTLTQQIGGEITAPLVGFLTNTKTGFNTLQNQLNEEFYNYCKSVYFNNTSKNLFKSIVDINAPTKTKLQDKYERAYKNHRALQDVTRKSHLKGGVYSQNYLPFSFYIRPISRFNLLTSEQCKAKQSIVRQNIFGKILAWRLKGQHPSSLFYSQFKIFDQRNKYKSKQLTMPNQSNIQAFKVMGFTKLAFTKPQVLFKNTKNFITFKSPIIYKAGLRFYSNYKSHRINSKENRSVIPSSIRDIYFKLKKNKHNSSILVKKGYSNSIDHFYINRFYQSVKDGRTYSNQNKNSITNRSSIAGLFRNHSPFKANKSHEISLLPFLCPTFAFAFGKTKVKGQKQRNKVIPRLFRYHEKKFHNYYDKFIDLNQFNQYQMFAKSPFINNKLADIMFFINPEKNQNLVNQANCLKIPTIGVISGLATSRLGRPSCNRYSLNNLVNYPIVGNPSSSFFIYSLIGVFIKTLRSS
uniref:Ribosomal protein S2 n=1 Tax=Ulva lacinulata TaxID=2806530 RepID=A0A7L9R4P8_9CHLO|nr:ribosomal protein S2 [Ulva lacinulata]QOL10362.1 ribosomal protein S2 [Ulva lacinulata]ULC80537.1 ribosomal protein S2 [Ulva rigida]